MPIYDYACKLFFKYRNYYIKNGRKYLINPEYYLLCDKEEINRIISITASKFVTLL